MPRAGPEWAHSSTFAPIMGMGGPIGNNGPNREYDNNHYHYTTGPPTFFGTQF